MGILLDDCLDEFAKRLGCEASDLHLDHDPALENREKVFKCNVHIGYEPDANNPDHLFYRPYGPEFFGSHKIKTLIRGDHGQLSDAGLARKRKRFEKKRAKKKIPSHRAHRSIRKKAWPSRPWPTGRKMRSKKWR
jgi:hypothetical protein